MRFEILMPIDVVEDAAPVIDAMPQGEVAPCSADS